MPYQRFLRPSEMTGFFCAVNVPVYEGFTKAINSLSPSKREKNAKNPLFFSVLRGTRRISFSFSLFINDWYLFNYKNYASMRFLALIGGGNRKSGSCAKIKFFHDFFCIFVPKLILPDIFFWKKVIKAFTFSVFLL